MPETTGPVTAEDLRERLTNVVTTWALMYPLGNYGIWGTAGASRDQLAGIAEDIAAAWGRDIADRVLTELAGDPGDLPARMAEALYGAFLSMTGSSTTNCNTITFEHLARVALSVRWEDHARAQAELGRHRNRITALEANGSELLARAERAEYDLEIRTHTARSNARAHRVAYLESEKQRERAEAAEAERDALTTELGHAQGTLADTRQEVGDLTDENRRLRSERDLLRETLAESDLGGQVLAQWEAIAAADADRDRLGAELAEAREKLSDAVVKADAHFTTYLETVAQREADKSAVERVRRVAQVWVDMRPAHPTATQEGHAMAYAGEQILAALAAPESIADAPSPVTAATETHREAGGAEDA